MKVEKLSLEEFLRLGLEHLSTPVFIINEHGEIIVTNHMLRELCRHADRAAYSGDIHSCFDRKEGRKVENLLKTTFEFGYSETEISLDLNTRKNKNFFLSLNRFTYLSNKYAVGELHDISLRVKSEKELQKALAELRILSDNLEKENCYLREEIYQSMGFAELKGISSAIDNMHENIRQVANTDAPVLIMGEYGTGKEFTGRLIHRISKRKNHPFIKVNCSTTPSHILEKELFGDTENYAPGKNSPGKFRLAEGGTLLLKEVNKLPRYLQNKLLDALCPDPLLTDTPGKHKTPDVRIISTSNEMLRNLVDDDRFSEELYYRICIFPIELPPLRARKEDIMPLVQFFISSYNKKYNYRINRLPKKFFNALCRYDWPGNIGELRSFTERAVIASKGNTLHFREAMTLSNPDARPKEKKGFKAWKEHEKEYIRKVLEHTGWKVRGEHGAAHILELKPTTLESKIKRLELSKPVSTP